MPKKKAMVQPPAGRPDDLPLFADPALEARLIKTLQKKGNDRPYTVIEYHTTWAAVHFSGDEKPIIVKYTD